MPDFTPEQLEALIASMRRMLHWGEFVVRADDVLPVLRAAAADLVALDKELTATPRGMTLLEALLDEREWMERADAQGKAWQEQLHEWQAIIAAKDAGIAELDAALSDVKADCRAIIAAKDAEIARLRQAFEVEPSLDIKEEPPRYGMGTIVERVERAPLSFETEGDDELRTTREALRQLVEVGTALQDRHLPEDLRPAFDAALAAGVAASQGEAEHGSARTVLQQCVEALASQEADGPPLAWPDGDPECAYCERCYIGVYDTDRRKPEYHEPDCPWARGQAALAAGREALKGDA